ncbi:MAG: flagellar motor protein [Alicyclobacillus macrosporangiidus]|uniref:flagellar motor protein n=1 Tax=Alicyclobacillus macrosporangiidus TaxID=392015 RepID=UPI0026F0F70D|nr:flagellar motor protein [Alicyclobacillus macrosporangiidus]MCL6600191.1 flagellar motor protein [Alicyclobacillus macrosporangiidus]
MDFATVAGVLLAVVSLVMGFTLDGGNLNALVQPTAFLIVVGGTLGATLTSVSLKEFIGLLKYIRVSLISKQRSPLNVIDDIVRLATIARREGLLALEGHIANLEDEFTRKGIQFVVDGVDQELIKTMLETELAYIDKRHDAAAHIFEMAGGFAPTMGIIGTVMGLVHVLSDLSNVDTLGQKIATAFTATLYGVASANVFWLPLANKLRRRHMAERLTYEIVMEGVLSIAAGQNPKILDQKLRAFLASSVRQRIDEKSGPDVVADEAVSLGE